MANDMIWLPVAPSFKGFGAAMVKEVTGASRQAADRLDADMSAAGKKAGGAAGKGVADGVKASAAQIDKASNAVAQARKKEADAAANVLQAEARLAESRKNGAGSEQLARQEATLEQHRRRQESAARQLSAAEQDVQSVRDGGTGRAQAVIRTENQLEKARLDAAQASDKVALAEAKVTELQYKGEQSASKVAKAEADLVKARSEQASATDILSGKEQLHQATLEDVEQQAKATSDAVEDAGKKAEKSGGFMSKAGDGAKKLALGLGAAAATGIGVALTKGLSRINQIDQATAKLTGLGHSAQSVEQIMTSATDAVTGTAFGLGDAATVAAATVAAGIKPGEDLTRTLKLVGDAATIAGLDMSSMGSIVNKVATSDMMQMDVANQLMDAGIPILSMVADQMGVTTEEARKMASEGKVSFETFQTALEGGLGGAALESGNTLTGSFDNLMAAMGRLGESALKPFIQDGKDIIGMLTEWVNSMTGQVGPAVEGFADYLVTTLIPAIKDAATWIRDNKDWLAALVVGIVAGTAAFKAYQGALVAITAVQKLYTAAVALSNGGMKALNTTMKANVIGLIVAAVVALVAGLVWFFTQTETGKKVWESFMGVIQKGVDFFKQLVNFGKMVVDVLFGGDFKGEAPFGLEEDSGVVSFLFKMRDAAIAVKDAVVGAWDSVIKPVFTGIANIVKWVGAIFAAVILGGVLVGWELLKVGISAAWGIIEPIINGLGVAFQWAGDVLGTVFSWMRENWQLVVSVVFGPLGALVALAITHWDTLKNAVMVVWNTIATAIQWAWQSIIMPIWNAMVAYLQFVGSVFQTVWGSIIKPTWDALGAGIAWVWNNIVRPAWDALKAALSVVGGHFQSIWNGVIKPVWNALGAGIRAVYDSVISPAFDALKSGLSSVGDFFRTVVEGIRSVWDAMKGHVARPINFVIDTVWNNGLVKAWNTIAGFLPGLPEASRLAPVAFAEGGPVPMMPGATAGKDSVHALMMPNEHVWDVANVNNAGGHGEMYKMRNMVDAGVPFTWIDGRVVPAGHGIEPQRFAEGGAVNGARLDPSPGEGGLKPIAILAKRLIHRIWPSIDTIGGYRQDAYPEHPSGRALDVMVGVGNPIGDEVTSWALANNEILPLIHALWKQTVWMPNGSTQPMGDRGNPTQNHMDHPHLWYQPKDVDPSVIPDGLVGHDGLTRDDRLGVIKEKIGEILDKALDPIREGMTAAIGTPPPEMLGIPPIALDRTKEAAVDGAFNFAENIAGDLKEVYSKAKDVVTSITGLFRDEGGFIPAGKSIVNNETGKPEAVLNWEQLHDVIQLMESAQGLEALSAWASGDPRQAVRMGVDMATVEAIDAAGLQLAESMEQVLQSAGDKAATGYRDEALDFFGFKGLFDDVSGLWGEFNKPPAAATSGVQTAVATSGPTSAGGGVAVHGDPNLTYETHEVELETKMPDFDRETPPGTGAERWRPMMIDALRHQGMNDWADNSAIVDRFIRQIQTESNGDPNIAQQIVDMNGTGEAAGVGLGQAIPGTWAAYRDPSLPDDRRNGWSMLNFMARYVRQKYGEQGYESIGNGIGYDLGGIADGIGFMPKYTLQPERVLSPRQTAAFEGWMGSGAAASAIDASNWQAIDNLLVSLPSAAQFERIAALADTPSDGPAGGGGSSGPVLHIENLVARDEGEAMRAAAREARRLTRSSSMSGGWTN